jgi:Ca-activated chloride channel family protein
MSSLMTIAKDVKIQIEFNPAKVAAYRLIGYENRKLARQDFNNDAKDAGEIGAGHTVAALYELVPVGQEVPEPFVDKLKYQKGANLAPAADTNETLTLKLRYKLPDETRSKRIEYGITDGGNSYANASSDLKFASSVAAFGLILRGSRFRGNATLEGIQELAGEAKGEDKSGKRAEFLELVGKARRISGN